MLLDGEQTEGAPTTKHRRLNVAEEIKKRTALKEKELDLRERELKHAEKKEARDAEEKVCKVCTAMLIIVGVVDADFSIKY